MMWRTFITRRVESARKILRTQVKKLNGRLVKPPSIAKNKMAADSTPKRKETWNYARPAWLIADRVADRKMMQEFYLD